MKREDIIKKYKESRRKRIEEAIDFFTEYLGIYILIISGFFVMGFSPFALGAAKALELEVTGLGYLLAFAMFATGFFSMIQGFLQLLELNKEIKEWEG